MRYRFRIDLRALKRPKPSNERVELSQEASTDEVELLEETGDPRVKAYNASLSWVRSQRPGKFVAGRLEYNVLKGPQGTFHVITRPREQRNERLSEVVLFPEGQLLSRSLARQEGEPLDLAELFVHGLEGPDLEDQALAEFPGYELQATLYRREENTLLEVVRWQRFWDVPSQTVIHHESSG